MFVLKMSCIDFNTAMYLLPVEVLQFSTNFYACAASVAYIDATPLVGPFQRIKASLSSKTPDYP